MRKSFGFTAVEGLLILVIVGILGFTGWYVWNSKQNTDKTNTAATQASNQATAVKTPAINIVKIPELGVQFNVPDSIKDLTYSYRTSQTSDGKKMLIVDFSTTKLTTLDAECAANKTMALGAMAKVDGNYPTEDSQKAEVGSLAKQFNTYYVSFSRPQAYCSENMNTKNLLQEQYDLLKEAVKSIKEA